jgi:hypothetical protein
LTARIAEDSDLEMVLSEVQALRLSHKADVVVDLLPVVVPALLNAAPYDPSAGVSSKQYTRALKQMLKQWGRLIEVFLRGKQDQLSLLGTVFDWVCGEEGQQQQAQRVGPDKKARMEQVGYIVQFLYEFDVVEPEVSEQPHAHKSYRL